MEKFTTLTGVAAPMPLVNIDTDMIIPKQFLKTIQRSGLGKNLFDEMRYAEDGSENPDFVLNKPAYRETKIPVMKRIVLPEMKCEHTGVTLLYEWRETEPGRLAAELISAGD